MRLLLEFKVGGHWQGVNSYDGPGPGSIANTASGEEEVLVYERRDDRYVIMRSPAKVKLKDEPGRVIDTEGLEVLAELSVGEEFEFDLKNGRMPAALPARFRCEA
ncbi:MAG: hypothetical protein BWY43_00026 [candidate division WS2 bacterium ADurb.Bin280]|uniref:Uncharacterized protein n=1 Tax=candidate division WS2 bacterium ADurb.Bin280 TaxID=1852829 RepID=A0A1V5SFT6_9BACT|nr:MAG: hypothetical protein BWY43_00026 [candidate division WS2 bacterium ADurb.Bin280]